MHFNSETPGEARFVREECLGFMKQDRFHQQHANLVLQLTVNEI